jgi:hypothetical protein
MASGKVKKTRSNDYYPDLSRAWIADTAVIGRRDALRFPATALNSHFCLIFCPFLVIFSGFRGIFGQL